MSTAEFYPISIDLSNSKATDRLYYRKGVQVDRLELGIPVLLSRVTNQGIIFQEIEVAHKYNVPGFWDEAERTFIKEPIYRGQPGQENHIKHTPEKLRSEKNIMWKLKQVPELTERIPYCFDSDDTKLVTEFRQGRTLESILTDKDFNPAQRTSIGLQMMDFVYHMHTKAHTHHNDFHDKNILIDPNGKIVVLDFGMAGEKNLEQKPTWWDVNQMARSIVRMVIQDEEENRRPLTEKELQQYGSVRELFSRIPFDSDEVFYEVYEQWLLSLR